MKKRLSIISIVILSLVFSFAVPSFAMSGGANKLTIVTTLFPQYDFVRQIAKDKVNVVLLLPPGVESHSFEPTPRDVVTISNADVFIYTGPFMEPWANRILEGARTSKLTVLDLFGTLNIKEMIATEHEGLLANEDAHAMLQGHDHWYDPHIWLDLSISVKMVDSIANLLAERDPANADFYRANAEEYMEKLTDLDNRFFDMVFTAERSSVVFGGRFAYAYFVRRYFLEYEAAYASCSAQSEPSVQAIAHIIEYIKENEIPVVYYEELVDPKVAKSIADQTGTQLMLFQTGQNISKEEFNSGITFLDIMEQNLENLTVGLN